MPSYPPYIPGAGPCLSLPPLLRSQPPATPLCRPGPENRSENSSQDGCEMQNGNLHERMFIVVVQSLSCVRLCDPRNVTHQGSLFFTISWSLLRFMSIDFPGGSDGRGLPTTRETRVRFLGREDPLEKETATHSSTPAWKIPWTEDPGRLQSTGSRRVRRD